MQYLPDQYVPFISIRILKKKPRQFMLNVEHWTWLKITFMHKPDSDSQPSSVQVINIHKCVLILMIFLLWNLVVFLVVVVVRIRLQSKAMRGQSKSSFCYTKDEMMMKKKEREEKENYKGSSVGSLRLKFITMIGFFQLKKFQIYWISIQSCFYSNLFKGPKKKFSGVRDTFSFHNLR